MQLHQLKSNHPARNKKRIGRGGKRGTYSGRGQKGQKSRAGHRIRPAERDLIQRLPKLRGFKNKPLYSKPAVINLSDLEKRFSGQAVDKKTLVSAGLIGKQVKQIKILSKGEIKKPLEIKGLAVSKSARRKIEAAGGSITKTTDI